LQQARGVGKLMGMRETEFNAAAFLGIAVANPLFTYIKGEAVGNFRLQSFAAKVAVQEVHYVSCGTWAFENEIFDRWKLHDFKLEGKFEKNLLGIKVMSKRSFK
jgi:hypothetical protein